MSPRVADKRCILGLHCCLSPTCRSRLSLCSSLFSESEQRRSFVGNPVPELPMRQSGPSHPGRRPSSVVLPRWVIFGVIPFLLAFAISMALTAYLGARGVVVAFQHPLDSSVMLTSDFSQRHVTTRSVSAKGSGWPRRSPAHRRVERPDEFSIGRSNTAARTLQNSVSQNSVSTVGEVMVMSRTAMPRHTCPGERERLPHQPERDACGCASYFGTSGAR